MIKVLAILIALTASAFAQSGQPIKQSGNTTPTHVFCVTTNGIAQDCGTAAIPFATTFGTWGTGPTNCAWTALVTSGAAQQICLGGTTSGGAEIYVQNHGTAPAQPLTLNLNGSIYQFPFSGSGAGNVVGPVSSTIANLASWNNSTGTLLQDTGVYSPPYNATFYPQTGGNVAASTPGEIAFGNGLYGFYSPYQAVTTGDCTVGDFTVTVTGTPTSGENPGFTFAVSGQGTTNITVAATNGETNTQLAAALVAAMKSNSFVKSQINISCPDGIQFTGTGANSGGASTILNQANIVYYDLPWPVNLNYTATAITTTHTTITVGADTGTGQNTAPNPSSVWERHIAGRTGLANDSLYRLTWLGDNGAAAAVQYGQLQFSVVDATAGAEISQALWSFGAGGFCGLLMSGTTSLATLSAPAGCQLRIPATASIISPLITAPALISSSNINWVAAGGSSGDISFLTQPNSGTYNYNLPTTAGTAGNCLKSDGGGSGGGQTWGPCGTPPTSNTVSGTITMTSANTFYDGPSVAQGSTGTWCAMGNISVTNATDDVITAKLWDGTTTIDFAYITTVQSSIYSQHLSGCLASPAGNLRISASNTDTAGKLIEGSGASTLTVWRVQ